jgi:CRP-like cAMP-binding protein
MSEEEIIAVLSGLVTLSPAFESQLRGLLVSEVYQSHQIIDAPGLQQHRMWMVVSGIIRRYYFDDNGKEITDSFYTAQDLIFFWEGYWSQRTDHYLETLSITRVYTLRYADLAALQDFQETTALTRYFIGVQRKGELFRSRLLLQSATARYQLFRKANPVIFREVPLRLIASYLNMTRENLSRLIGKDF